MAVGLLYFVCVVMIVAVVVVIVCLINHPLQYLTPSTLCRFSPLYSVQVVQIITPIIYYICSVLRQRVPKRYLFDCLPLYPAPFAFVIVYPVQYCLYNGGCIGQVVQVVQDMRADKGIYTGG